MLQQLFIKTPWWAKKLYPSYVWHISSKEKVVYLTFDDGPHPTITPWVLNELRKHDAKATFFCIGDNVRKHPEIFRQVIDEGHCIGNHTQHHLNGWKTNTSVYLNDVSEAATLIPSNLFRPPYGKIKRAQAKGLEKVNQMHNPKVIMWDVLSVDYDRSLSPKQCEENVLKNVVPGSIVVFHDSEKAFKNLSQALPAVLKNLHGAGYKFGKINM